MLKHITFHLRGPLCNCKEQALTWMIGEKNEFIFGCKTCKVRLTVPFEHISARTNLDTPYPGVQDEKEEVKNPPLKAIPGGKVLPLRTDQAEQLEEDES